MTQFRRDIHRLLSVPAPWILLALESAFAVGTSGSMKLLGAAPALRWHWASYPLSLACSAQLAQARTSGWCRPGEGSSSLVARCVTSSALSPRSPVRGRRRWGHRRRFHRRHPDAAPGPGADAGPRRPPDDRRPAGQALAGH